MIRFVGITCDGKSHDYAMLKEQLPPHNRWFGSIGVVADLGYQGIQTDYDGENIEIPHKKPKKSKARPNPQLTDEQKAKNRRLSQVRILVENAICGLKRFNILNHPFRNRNSMFDDDVISLSAGLWNFLLA